MNFLKNSITITLFTVLFVSCGNTAKITQQSDNKIVKKESVKFNIDLNNRKDDTFKVTVTAPKLSAENNIFQFASSAPGTYQVMDLGRFVKTFTAMDKKGNLITTTQISTNQFEISSPEKVKTIIYEISETYDTPVKEHPIYPMAGTSIENDHALINGQAVFGYFKGLQDREINIKIEYPENWKIGTALRQNSDGYFVANSYDHVVDSPILLGNLTKATTLVDGTNIDIYTYSAKGMIKSEEVLETIEGMLHSASKFLNGLPVDHYTFLLFMETNPQQKKGAWEHSYSSLYTLNEKNWDKISNGFKDMAAHEFFHIVTPLNIHSEIIQEFNFITPIASQHLWLYEGTTEWASHMMLFRSGEKSFEDYLKTLRRKAYIATNYYSTDYSLLELSNECFTATGQKQYANIYMKGALVAGMLDIRLLELSGGERGLIDVVNELAKIYGPNKAFNEATFFTYFTDFTYPEIAEFFELYVKKATPLPYKEYYQKIGIQYNAKKYLFTVDENATEEQLKLRTRWMERL
ncbi:MAG: hypothetical protein QM478_05140 [Flavobacteriaceae bacterium]